MANIWLFCLAILCSFCAGDGARPVGYNVVSSEEFKQKISSNPDSDLLRVAYFVKPGLAQGHIATAFRKNFEDAGKYLQSFKIIFMSIDCKKDPVREYCDKPKVDTLVFVFRDDYLMDEMPLDILYSVDAIVANVLHLALLTDVPTVHSAFELSALKQRNKGKKDVIFGKLLAIGTPADRAFMEGAFVYSEKYQFAMTTNRADNLLGTSDNFEWEEVDDRVWYFGCASAEKEADCERVIYRGPMTVQNFAIFLKTLSLPVVYEESTLPDKLVKPLHETLNVPVAYLITTAKDYDEHKQVMEQVGRVYKGNLAFAINTTEPGMVTDICPRPPPCVSIKPPGKYPMGLSKPFNFVNMAQLVEDWLNDYFFDPHMEEGEEEDYFGPEPPEQEKQDDSVALAVDQMKPLKLNLTGTPALTDKTFQKFLDDNEVAIVTFTVKWDPRSLAFLYPYLQAAKTLMKEFNLDHSPLARVECSDWPDVCESNSVAAFPTIKVYRNSRFVTNYKGLLNTSGIMKAYKLHSMPNPVKITDAEDIGKIPQWYGDLLHAVTIAVIPDSKESDKTIFTEVGNQLQGEYLLGICTGQCAVDAKIQSSSTLIVYKSHDVHQAQAKYKGEFEVSRIKEFIERASLPVLPELTPASLPKYFSRGIPFLILFRVPGEDSDRIERVLAKLGQSEQMVIMSWIDASPQSVGSRLLHEYKFKEISPPNLVFLDHSTGRVCNYPDVEMIKSENDLFTAVGQWILDLLRNEGSCNALQSGHFEPQVPSYDFLSRIKENRKRKQEKEQARGRFVPSVHHDMPEDAEEGEPFDSEKMEKFEDEMFGISEEKERGDMKSHGHVEL